MKRGGNLRSDPDKTQAWLDRSRKRLPFRSAKRAGEAPEREEVRRLTLARARFRCEAAPLWADVACAGRLDVHEPLTRARGGSPLDLDNCMAICRAHHNALHDNPRRAERVGLLHHSWH